MPVVRYFYSVTTVESDSDAWEKGCTIEQVMNAAEDKRRRLARDHHPATVNLIEVKFDLEKK